jgi:hypothetical protein
MFLSTPLTVAAMVILAQFEGSRWIAILLSEDGDPQGERPGSQGRPWPRAGRLRPEEKAGFFAAFATEIERGLNIPNGLPI